MKIKWHVAAIPTGRYRSFERRGWPSAEYADGRIAAWITCADDYYPPDVRAGTHAPLILRVADHSIQPFKWRKMIVTFRTLAEAKVGFEKLLAQHPELAGK